MRFKWWLIAMQIALWSGTASAQDVSQCPDNFVAYSGTSDRLACSCDESATRRGSVWGMDTYTADSSICVAAVHAGAIPRRGGQVNVIPEAGKSAYPGVTRNGIASNNFGAYESSFRFERQATGASGAASAPAQTAQAPSTVSVCPDNFTAYADTNEPVNCSCDASAVARGSVWGMDVYTGDSAICRAALHAGVISRQGGTVSVLPEPGRSAYPGVTRNGVQSINFAAYASSFRFAGVKAASAAPGATTAAITVCPDDMMAYVGSGENLTCTCDAAATQRGSVWGMDVYTGDSAVCRAALHAGIVPRQGGQVTAIPEAGRSAYPGATRNGVQSQNFGAYESSFRFAPGAGAAAMPPKPMGITSVPIQQNIQSSLRERGQVDLYVRFKTNSADLEISAADTMRTLQTVLMEDPSLRLKLIGHTDSVGTPQYNQTLSYRRAEAVKAWLVEQGISASRLAVDGLGQTQPLADNLSEFGRATNRRVQAIRM